jgi:hypothetical protein
MSSKSKWSSEVTVIYRHHPVDRIVGVVAIALAALLALGRWLPDVPHDSLTLFGVVGFAVFFAVFFAFVIWGILNEHRLDADIDRAIAQGDENLKRARQLSEHLSERLKKDA